MALTPMAMYGLEVPPGDVPLSARPDIPSAFRITMAALDPSAEPEGDEGAVPRATLKVIRQSLLADDDDFDEDDFDQEAMERMLAEDYSDEDSEESSDDEDVNGGPSDPAKTKKARKEAAKLDIQKLLQEADGMEVDDESDDDAMPNGVNGIAKSKKARGKMPASDEDDDEDDDSEMDEDFVEEYVICTLDPTKLYQQPLDLTFGEDEKVWFKVSGTHSIYLTGNYVEPAGAAAPGLFDPDSDDEEDYDLEPDMDELEDSDDDDSVEDELDDIENPRITEINADEEVPTLVRSKKGKALANKNKRPAVDSDDEDAKLGADGLDAMITEAKLKVEPTVNGDKKLSKQERKKLKKNDGAAATPPVVDKVEKKEVDVPPSSASNKSDKKVSFAKELEQGPTPTPTKDSKDAKSTDKAKGPALGVKTVQGVTLDDKKLGSGQAAKNGDRVSMRYIGKLQSDGSVFDSNKKGKPFGFKLGAKEVIQGWEIGVQGMQAGGERRITIPAHLAYGSKKLPGIPPNSTLVFDIKVLEVGKK